MTQKKIKKIKQPKLVKGKINEKGLNIEQEAFCQCYTVGDREFFGNGVQSYIEVYKPDRTTKNRYKTALASASRLLTNVNIIKRINELLEEGGLNDQNVDKQLSFLVTQFEDKSSKLAAIKEYNRLKARVIEKGTEVNVFNLEGKDLRELEEMRQKYLNSK